jgi:acyl-CoA thioesterase FadM
MTVTFRRPVPLETPLRADGWITRTRRRIMDTESRLIDATTGVELATATGVYLSADEQRKTQLRARYGFIREQSDT